MSNVIVFRRRVDALIYDDLRSGEYWQIRRGARHGDTVMVVWRCPICGVLASLRRNTHAIDHEGRVDTVITCYNKACKFVHTVVLEDWVPEAVASA